MPPDYLYMSCIMWNESNVNLFRCLQSCGIDETLMYLDVFRVVKANGTSMPLELCYRCHAEYFKQVGSTPGQNIQTALDLWNRCHVDVFRCIQICRIEATSISLDIFRFVEQMPDRCRRLSIFRLMESMPRQYLQISVDLWNTCHVFIVSCL